MAARTLSYSEAQAQAATLRKQGLTYPKIAEHLASIGYISPKTKAAVGEQAVRHMLVKEEIEPSKTTKNEVTVTAAAETIKVRGPKQEVIDALRKIPSLGLTPELSQKLVNVLLEAL